MSAPLDAARTNPMEGGVSYTLSHRLFRLVWNLAWAMLASWTPPPLHGWRRFLLRLFGANIDGRPHVYGSAQIWYPPNLTLGHMAVLGPHSICYCMAPTEIGAYATISQHAFLCAGSHDVDDPHFQLIAKSISIGPSAWVASRAFVGPGVIVGEGAVLGACAVATRNYYEPWTIYAGNPAKKIRARKLPRTREA